MRLNASAGNVSLAQPTRKHAGCGLTRPDRIRRKLGLAGKEVGAKKTAGKARGQPKLVKPTPYPIYCAIKIRPVNERSTEERPTGDIGIRVTALSPIPCPTLRIRCQRRNVSLRRPDEFPAPQAQGIFRTPLT
jgi:hypothetical protein